MRVRKIGVIAIGAVCVLVATTACSSSKSKPAAGSSGPSGSPSSSGSCSSTIAGYCDLVAKAEKEGTFDVLSGPEGVGDDGDFYKAFGKQFGLKVNVVGGAADEVNAKVLAARSQGIYTADVSSQGANGTTTLLKANAFEPLAPLFMGSAVTDRSKDWRVDYVPWEDPGKKYCTDIAVESQVNMAPIWYNTKLVKGADLASLTSWKSLLDSKWKGKIVMGDIAAGDDSSDLVRVWVKAGLGQSWFNTLLHDQSPKILPFGSERDEADDLARGTYAIALFPAGEDSLQTAQTQKLPVAPLGHTMAEGTSGTPIQRLCVLDHPAHPAVAQLFVNWALSVQGQTAFNATTNRTDRVALRSDVPQGKVSDAIWDLAQKTKATDIIDPSSAEYLNGYKDSVAFFKKVYTQLGIKP